MMARKYDFLRKLQEVGDEEKPGKTAKRRQIKMKFIDTPPGQSDKIDMTFSGAGFMGAYYIGVIDCWKQFIPKDRVGRVAGASAGSLVAAQYMGDVSMPECFDKILTLLEDVRKRPLGVFDRSNQIVDVLPKTLNELFPDDIHKRVSGRIFICTTRLRDRKKIIVSEFETKQDLIDTLNCSCFIPVWSGNHVATYKGEKHLDGGFKDNLPTFDEHTVRVCPFSGETDISPFDGSAPLPSTLLNTPLFFTLANLKRGKHALWPPPASYLYKLIERGFEDTREFLLLNDMVQCDECFKKTKFQDQLLFRNPSPAITPRASPAGSPVAPRRNSANKRPASPAVQNDQNDNSIDGSETTGPIPTIEIDSPDQTERSASRAPHRRRSTIYLDSNTNLLKLQDRFTPSPEPLPSCPPSPDLNRHCTECLKLRQDVRMATIDEEIKKVAAKYITNPDSNFKKTRTSKMNLLGWIKNWRNKASYKFQHFETPSAIAV